MKGRPGDDLATAVSDLVKLYFTTSAAAMRSLGGIAKANPLLEAFTAALPRSACHIPEPCWMPRSLGELRSTVCPGGTASVRVRVTNARTEPTQITVAFGSTFDASGKVTPASAVVGPMERATFDASLTLPSGCKAAEQEVLLWIRGCNAHFVRWTLEASDSSAGACHHLEVSDGPDYVHHWYDHFYCDRGCFGTAK
jgi:hypothetical protein